MGKASALRSRLSCASMGKRTDTAHPATEGPVPIPTVAAMSVRKLKFKAEREVSRGECPQSPPIQDKRPNRWTGDEWRELCQDQQLHGECESVVADSAGVEQQSP